jgi:hypothetical protein
LKPSAKRAKPFGLKFQLFLELLGLNPSILNSFYLKLINSFSPKGLARLAEGFNPALELGKLFIPHSLALREGESPGKGLP